MDEIEALGKKIRDKPVIKPFETKIKSESEILPYFNKGWDSVKGLKNTK